MSESGFQFSTKDLLDLATGAAELKPASRRSPRATQFGSYLSRIRGRGMEFDEVRAYMPGDDIRSMDWRVTARRGEPHTKLYREERERPVLFMLDLGPSMQFGSVSRFKSVSCGRLMTRLAWAAQSHGDRIGGVLTNGPIHRECRPRGGRRGVLQLIHAAIELQQQALSQLGQIPAGSYFNEALIRLRKVVRPGSIVYVFSDFKWVDDRSENHLAGLARHNDLICIRSFDPLEENLPTSGSFSISNGEGVLRYRGGDRALQSGYVQLYQQQLADLQQFCRDHRISLHHYSSSDDVRQFRAVRAVTESKTPTSDLAP